MLKNTLDLSYMVPKDRVKLLFYIKNVKNRVLIKPMLNFKLIRF
jgi:hypothetical protein